MNKRIIAGLVVNIIAAAFYTSTINAAPAQPLAHGPKKEIRKDDRHFRHDRHSARYHKHDMRHHRAELKRDRAVRDWHLRHGHNAAAAHKQHEIRHDKKYLRHERKHRHHGRHHTHDRGHHHGGRR